MPIFLLVFLCVISLFSCQSRFSHQADGIDNSDLRRRFLECYNTPTMTNARQNHELQSMAEAFYMWTSDRARQKNEADLMILDELGHPVEDVSLECRFLYNSGLSALEPNMNRDTRQASGVIKIHWPVTSYAMEIDVSKLGYRKITIELRADKRSPDERFEWATESLFKGAMLPPQKPNGPIRVVLPPALKWNPQKHADHSSEDFTPYTPERDIWPKKLPQDPKPVVTSDAPRPVAVDRRGTYALIDKDGKVINLRQLDQGNIVFLSKEISAVDSTIIYRAGDIGGGGTLKPTNPPYQWQFYSAPVLAKGTN